MGDFHQNGIITTLHNLNQRPLAEMEYELQVFSRLRPMTLILPSLYSELEGPALPNIISELKKVPYLSQIVIGLDRADRDQYLHAGKFFGDLPQHTIAYSGTTAHDCGLSMKNSRKWVWHRQSQVKAGTSGTAWATHWHPGKARPLHCMTVTS
jgi:hypothetical protein